MILHSGSQELEVSGRGATVTRWQNGETHILYPQQQVLVGSELKLRGGIPVCLPIHGQPNKTWQEKGMPQHGFLRQMYPLTMGEKNSTGTLVFKHEGAWNYPWFRSIVSIELSDTGFTHVLRVIKSTCSTGTLPIAPGIHPYFNTPGDFFRISFPESETKLTQKECKLGESVILKGQKAILHTALGRVTLMSLGYTQFVIWRDDPRYICIEPISEQGTFDTEEGIWVTPGMEVSFICNFEFTPS